MKIAKVETISIKVPYTFGGRTNVSYDGRAWTTIPTLLVRVETADGLVGWGEAFSYGCIDAVKAAIETMVAPIVIGRDASDITSIMRDLHRKLHLFGRHGITIFALSGLDIALWDLAGKAANLPLHRLLGGGRRDKVPGYASLLKYNDPELVAARIKLALAQGYRSIKLHETGVREVAAARDAAGSDVMLTVDVNCAWAAHEARRNATKLRAYDLYWLEEPLFPPEDFAGLARLRADTGVAMAAGENLCSPLQFRDMIAAGAVDFAQPSVTKVGGVTEFLKVQAFAETACVEVAPHSPYFGPGFLATLQLIAARPKPDPLAEYYHLDLEASLYGDLFTPVDGAFVVPDGPGLGRDPDPDVIRTYRAD